VNTPLVVLLGCEVVIPQENTVKIIFGLKMECGYCSSRSDGSQSSEDTDWMLHTADSVNINLAQQIRKERRAAAVTEKKRVAREKRKVAERRRHDKAIEGKIQWKHRHGMEETREEANKRLAVVSADRKQKAVTERTQKDKFQKKIDSFFGGK
jgi:hypothetical protein